MYLTSNDIKEFFYEIDTFLTRIYDVYYAIDCANNPLCADNPAALKDDFIPIRSNHYEQDAIIIRQESLPKYFDKIENLLIAVGNTSVGLAKAQKLYDSAAEKHAEYIGRCDYYKTFIAERDPNKPFDLAINYTKENLDAFLKHFDEELSLYKTAKLDHSKEYLTAISNVHEIKKDINVNDQNLGIERINEDLDGKPDNNKLANKPKKKELVYSFKKAITDEKIYKRLKSLIKHFKLKKDKCFLSRCTMQKALFSVLTSHLEMSYRSAPRFRKVLIEEFKQIKPCSNRALNNEYKDLDKWKSDFKKYLEQR